MAWREAAGPARMQRVALVCPTALLRNMLVCVADAGIVEIDRMSSEGAVGRGASEVARGLSAAGGDRVPAPRLCSAAPNLDELRGDGRADLLAGEAELESYAHDALVRDDLAALAGWVPAAEVPALARRLADVGAGVVPIPPPRGLDPPTLLRRGQGVRQSFTPLVETYGTVPYSDVDPSLLAGIAYVLMFGMMFGDAGHGALLLALGLLIRAGRPRRLARFRTIWLFVVGSGLFAIGFGLLYGEFFGPTGVIPVLWLSPLEEPVTLLAAALGVGAVLLAGAQAVGTVNRWREGGWPVALSASSGIAGAALLAGLGLIVLGAAGQRGWLVPVGAVVIAGGVALTYLGFLAGSGGGGAGVTQASVEVFDAVMRVGTNVVSFARLAAFGLTHAALGQIVWDGTTSLWSSGGLLMLAAAAVFLVGNVLAFGLEALVAGVQALRLEYYELFSRVFAGVGRPFHPWQVPTDSTRGFHTGDATTISSGSGRQP
ncbi:V-type ATPase 116kDa subunit family protein [Rhodococcus opacus]|uniref:V-type ATPase 116kDa subunit family protein n=1 Tax=Rhodococcus opacus TaxID=37919 RepID=UPI00223653CA|nr:V-type ATPase 116kDa subunit family protein [Rhodococcus opacus]UZG55248.1 ATPase [Rhodococcus opacus]